MTIDSDTFKRREFFKAFASMGVLFLAIPIVNLFLSSESGESALCELAGIVQKYGAEFGGTAVNQMSLPGKGG